MKRKRQRDKYDRDFRVVLVDTQGGTPPVSIPGTFYAKSPGEAIDVAIKTYPGLFASMETRSWVAEAHEVFTPPAPAKVP